VGTAETLNSAKRSREAAGGELDVGAADWAEEVAIEVEMEGVADADR